MNLPKHYDSKEAEKKWQEYWIKEKIFKFDAASKKPVFSIDTPPPTVSGKMHIGHAFSYTQGDFIARYQRMSGKNVFYPFGTDDNGLPTERLIEKMKGVKASFMDRDRFVKLCLETLEKELRPEYVADWKRIGLSCDWDIFYTTINEHCQKISQESFVELYEKKRIYRKKTPYFWCPRCQTAVAQVELEDLERESTLYHVKVKVSNGKELTFATTRPELAPACIALSVHPDDKRYSAFVGKTATIPATGVEIPIIADDMTKMEFGSGVVYWCPYGDISDVEFVAKHPELTVKHILNPDGKLNAEAGQYEGLSVKDARRQIVSDWAGSIVKEEAKPQVVNVHDRCGTEIEILMTMQWFVKYLDLRKDMLQWGKELTWYPDHMKVRYDHWAEGLKWDWCISRQRFYGIPFPVWFCEGCDEIIVADKKDLPVDPLKNKPKSCPACKGKKFIPEKDVMDTWATSSLTPQIATKLFKGTPVYKKLFPMSLRVQAHDIITFWLFNTMVKSQLHEGKNPWKDVVISGHALDPRGKKMSKSKGNVVEPQKVIEQHSADALRFWAAGTKLGDDLAYMEKDLVTGGKFVTKLWNACKFAIMHLEDFDGKKPKKLEIVDAWILSRMSALIKNSTASFDKYEYSRTKAEVENFFWHDFCDQYVEIVKDRLYNPEVRGEEERTSAQYALYEVSLAVLKLMAPIMPHITEEIYHLYFAAKEQLKSIHNSDWPTMDCMDAKADALGSLVVRAVTEARRAKTEQKLSLKEPLKSLSLKGKVSKLEFEKVKDDVTAATKAESISYEQLDAKSEIDCEADVVI